MKKMSDIKFWLAFPFILLSGLFFGGAILFLIYCIFIEPFVRLFSGSINLIVFIPIIAIGVFIVGLYILVNYRDYKERIKLYLKKHKLNEFKRKHINIDSIEINKDNFPFDELILELKKYDYDNDGLLTEFELKI